MDKIILEFRKFPQMSAILGMMLVAGLLIHYFDSRVVKTNFSRPVVDFPLTLGEWVGNSQSMTVGIVDFLKLSDYALIDFSSDDQKVNLYIAYYQSLGDEAFPHSPRKCIPGGGWEIETISNIDLEHRQVRRVKITRGNANQIVYYWYQQGADSVADEYHLKWNTMLRSLTQGRTDTSLIRLTTPLSPGESESSADARLARFAIALEGELANRLQSNKER